MYVSSPPAVLAGNGTSPPHDLPSPELPINWSSLIGIITAIVGNVLIALALNVQRYAHLRLHQQRAHYRDRARQARKKAANGRNGGRGAGSGYGTLAPAAAVTTTPPRNGTQGSRNDEAEAGEMDPLAPGYQADGHGGGGSGSGMGSAGMGSSGGGMGGGVGTGPGGSSSRLRQPAQDSDLDPNEYEEEDCFVYSVRLVSDRFW